MIAAPRFWIADVDLDDFAGRAGGKSQLDDPAERELEWAFLGHGVFAATRRFFGGDATGTGGRNTRPITAAAARSRSSRTWL